MGIYVALLFIPFRNTSVSLEHTFVLQLCIFIYYMSALEKH